MPRRRYSIGALAIVISLDFEVERRLIFFETLFLLHKQRHAKKLPKKKHPKLIFAEKKQKTTRSEFFSVPVKTNRATSTCLSLRAFQWRS